jgi:hypothetical protein
MVITWRKFQKLFPKRKKEKRLKILQFISTGGEKTSSQAKKYEKLLNDDEPYFIIGQELRQEDSKMTMSINSIRDIPKLQRRKEAEKPLYLMRYE